MTTPSEDLSNGTPLTFNQLTKIYYDRYKPLYSQVQTFNEMPVELIFEVAAAWDHVTRHWMYGESEASCVDKASRHVKRAIFDAFKLILKARVDEYDELRAVDTSLINNGEFDRELIALMAEIRRDAIDARMAEGNTSAPESWSDAFNLWDKVHANCEKFNQEFYLNDKVEWARKKTQEFTSRRRWEGFGIGVAASAVVTLVWWMIVG
ncbi:MAG: hypothetical protein GXX96_23150 [Planctomycetaceae bacterium]|nr:hypothetical protein [Planctomycetaceae bacterium]